MRAKGSARFTAVCKACEKFPNDVLKADIVYYAIDEYEKLLNDDEVWREEYRAKQKAGVKFERRWMDGTWHFGVYNFGSDKEEYREVPQEECRELPQAECRELPKNHSLYWRERVEGTDEVWQWGVNTTVWGDRVQPTAVKCFHVLISSDAGESREAFEGRLKRAMFCLMGDIEERDVGV